MIERDAPDRKLNYLIAVEVPCYRKNEERFYTESAFAEHLRVLRRSWAERFESLLIVAPPMSEEQFQARRNSLAPLDFDADGVRYVRMNITGARGVGYWAKDLIPNFRILNRLVRQAGVVHSGPSHLSRPFGCVALLLAVARDKTSIYVMDIDHRRSAWMNYRTGRWSLKSYLAAKLIHQPFMALQTWLAARTCSVVLLKGQQLCDDFGKHRGNVHNFLDSAFSSDLIIPPQKLKEKAERLRDPLRPLCLVYFGRLTNYKGVDRSIRALARAIHEHSALAELHVFGEGEEMSSLKALAESLAIGRHVIFHGSIPYGPALFERLHECDLLLATPLSEDTPRSALDAMACGIPLLAYDTYYYRDLERSGAVTLAPWLSDEMLAERIALIARNKCSLVCQMDNAVAFAHANTQEIWLERRHEWTLKAVENFEEAGRGA